jgi:hypothetical protein
MDKVNLFAAERKRERVATCLVASRAVRAHIAAGAAPEPMAIAALRDDFGLTAEEAIIVIRACFRPNGTKSQPVVPLPIGPSGLDLQDEWILATALAFGVPADHALGALSENARQEAVRMVMQNAAARSRLIRIDGEPAVPPVASTMSWIAAVLADGGDPFAHGRAKDMGHAWIMDPTPSAIVAEGTTSA